MNDIAAEIDEILALAMLPPEDMDLLDHVTGWLPAPGYEGEPSYNLAGFVADIFAHPLGPVLWHEFGRWLMTMPIPTLEKPESPLVFKVDIRELDWLARRLKIALAAARRAQPAVTEG